MGRGSGQEETRMNAATIGGQGWTWRVQQLLGSQFLVLVLCVLTSAAFSIAVPGFASLDNLGNILVASLPLLLLASGQTIVLISGGIDLSVTAIVGLSSIAGALVMSGDHGWLRGQSIAVPAAWLSMLATGAGVGVLNGACIAWLRMPPFMVTLTTTMFFHGAAVWLAKRIADAESIYNLPAAFLVMGRHPWIGIVLASFTVLVGHLLLGRTLLGRWIHAVGHNSRAAVVSGVPVAWVTMAAFVLSGLFASLASALITVRLETGSPAHGRALLLDVIGAVVIGGTSLFGGKGRIPWTLQGVAFLALLGNGLNLMNLSDFAITIVKGVVFLFAALLEVTRTRWLRAE